MSGWLTTAPSLRPTSVRPSRQLRFRDDAGAVYVGMLEPARILAAVATLSGELIDSVQQEWESSVGPDRTLEALHGMFARLERRTRAEPWAIGIGVSGTVDFGRGRILSSPALPGWDGFSIRSWLRDHYDVPVWVDRDVNLMALGEWRIGQSPHRPGSSTCSSTRRWVLRS